MRLLYICNEYPPAPHGGIGTFVQMLGRRLVAQGHQVWVIGYDSGLRQDKRCDDEGVQVQYLANPYQAHPRFRLGRLGASAAALLERGYLTRRARQLFTEVKPDLIESYDWSGPLWSAPGHPLVVRLHGTHTAHSHYAGTRRGILFSFLEGRNLALADHLVAVSAHIKATTTAAFRLNRAVTVLYNGVDTQHFRPLHQTREAGAVLYVGRIDKLKGVAELLQAWPTVLQQAPQAKLYLVGAYYATTLPALLAPLAPAVRESVIVVGRVPHAEVVEWYNRCQVAVFPSRVEAFGLTCAEAMACGCAVIMTDRGSGPELVEHQVSGLLADPSQPQQLAAAMLTLLEDEATRTRLGENARARIVARFDAARLTTDNVAYYQSVLGA